MRKKNELKNIENKVNAFCDEAEKLGFHVTSKEVKISRKKLGPKSTRAKLTTNEGSIEIKGTWEFVEKYLKFIECEKWLIAN